MSIERAIWHPFWYELDQSLEVGAVENFEFFRTPPANLAGEHVPIFFYGNWNDNHLYYSAKKRILMIHHPQIGRMQKIDASDLDYKLTLIDGTILKVNAEETPGVVCSLQNPVEDWRVFVEMESA